MFGIFDDLQESVENAFDVGLGIVTLNEYGDANKSTISKLVADGIEVAVIAQLFDTTEDIIKDMID